MLLLFPSWKILIGNEVRRFPLILTHWGRQFVHYMYIIIVIFVNEIFSNSIKIALKYVDRGPIDNIPVLVQTMVLGRPGDKALSEPMVAEYGGGYMRHTASMIEQAQWHSDVDCALSPE